MSTVWEQSKEKGSNLLLLLAIADHAADDGYCWPGTKTLAKKIRMSVRSVLRAIKTLEASGELYVVRGNINNRYVVTVGLTRDDLCDVLRNRKADPPPPIGDNLSPDTLTRDTGGGTGDTCVTSEVTQLCHPNHHEPSINRQEEEPLFLGGPSEEPATPKRDYLTDVMAHKKRMKGKKSWTVTGPEGADPWVNGPVDAFCKLAHMPTAPPGSVNAWARAFEKIAGPWGVGPSDVTEAIGLISKDEKHNWRSFSSPLVPSFKDVLDVMIARVRSGETGKIVRIRN